MKAIQLGLGHSIGSLTPQPMRDLLYEDFNVIETVSFPRYLDGPLFYMYMWSHGSVATYVTCGGKHDIGFIAHFFAESNS